MCQFLYIASEQPLTVVLEELTPVLFLIPVREPLKHFNLPYQYLASDAPNACACSFKYETGVRDEAEERKCRKAVGALRAFLRDAVRSGPIQLMAPWIGEEDREPRIRRRVSPEFFGGESHFQLPDDELLIVHENDSSSFPPSSIFSLFGHC